LFENWAAVDAERKQNQTMKSDNAELIGKHKFEIGGLGKAPFRFVGMSENRISYPDGTSKPGGTCDYCSTGILLEFHIKSADGKESIVGCNCIEKVDDRGLIQAYKSSLQYRQRQAELRVVKGKAAKLELEELIAKNTDKLSAMPHPMGFTDRKTGVALTMLDQVKWLFEHCGNAGMVSTLRMVKQKLSI
jgi:hypothetical protein